MMSTFLSQAVIDEFVGNAHGNFARVKEMLEQHPELANARASFNETALQATAQMGREDMANYLLAHGATLDIFAAAMLGMTDRVREFLQADRAQANAPGGHGFAPLYYAAVKNRVAIAELLLQNGANVNIGEGSNTPLHAAALNGHTEIAAWLIQQGANVNARNFENKTPLTVARDAKQNAVVELLLKHGASE